MRSHASGLAQIVQEAPIDDLLLNFGALPYLTCRVNAEICYHHSNYYSHFKTDSNDE